MSKYHKLLILFFGYGTFLISLMWLLSALFICYKVVKDIENRYHTTLEFHISQEIMPWGFVAKYTMLALYIVFKMLNEKKILKNKYYENKINPLVKIKYNVNNETKVNFRICIFHAATGFIALLFLIIGFLLTRF